MAILQSNDSLHRKSVVLMIAVALVLVMDPGRVLAQGPGSPADIVGIRIAGPLRFQAGSGTQGSVQDDRTGADAAETKDSKAATKPNEPDKSDERMKPRLQELQKPLGEIQFAVSRPSERTPANLASSVLAGQAPIHVAMSVQTLATPNRYPIAALHNPLYFQETNLERCGITWGCAQTATSAVDFFANAFMLPYRIAKQPWCRVEQSRLDCQTCGRLP